MKIWLRHTLLLVAVATFCTGSLAIRRNCLDQDRAMTCRGIVISIEGTHKFVTEEDVRQYLSQHCGKLIGRELSSIPLNDIENYLDNRSAVFKSQLWYTSDSLLHVNVMQRKPVARFMKDGTGFYVDDRGFIFPLHPTYTAEVPVVSGNIPVHAGGSYRGPAASAAERQWIGSILKTIAAIGGSRIWRNSFPSITIDSNRDIVIKPEYGQEKFIFGRPDENNEKLSRIKTYYTKIMPNKPEGFYKTVNVKYNGQIVCRQ